MSGHIRARWTLALAALYAFSVSGPLQAEPVSPECPCGVSMDSLVSVEWLREHLEDPDLVVLDASVMVEQMPVGGFRTVSGRTRYEAGHIPGAGFVDLLDELSDTGSPFDYALPAPEAFARAMSLHGVSDTSRVVLYDAAGTGWATRVWWMLRWIGFDQAAVLDGGMQAWTAAGYALSADPVEAGCGQLSVSLRPGLIADRAEVTAALTDSGVVLVDAMPEAHYRGDMKIYARTGHIPGAVNVPASSLREPDGRYLSTEDLDRLLPQDHDRRSIVYCGGGISASSVAFAMIRAGFSDVAVYTASLQEWAADPDNPMELEQPTASLTLLR